MDRTSASEGGESFRNTAFISYSSGDKAWAKWLQNALEGYRVPKRLVGTTGSFGPVPRRLSPIARDRSDFKAGHSLTEEIRETLEQSRYLIVICSPRSAASGYVNEEILLFKRLGREDQILTIIVEGEPNSTDRPGKPPECFAPALRFQIDADGKLTDIPAEEPLAADVRNVGDGRENAKLKLIAGLLGVEFDTLKRREAEARRTKAINWTAAVASVLSVFLGIVAFLLRGQALDASAAKFVAEANGDLSQRDYARAEIAAAQALTYRDRPEIRDLLLTARLGGITSTSHSAPRSTPN